MIPKHFVAIAALAAIIFTGCKPTENNYKQAYDIAVQKKKQAETDPDMDLSAMKSENAPKVYKINGDSVFVKTVNVKVFDPENAVLHPFNVVMASYKMPTNALSQSENFRDLGLGSEVLQTMDETYMVSAECFDELEDAANFAIKYVKSNKNMIYPGLDGAPLIVIPSRLRVVLPPGFE